MSFRKFAVIVIIIGIAIMAILSWIVPAPIFCK